MIITKVLKSQHYLSNFEKMSQQQQFDYIIAMDFEATCDEIQPRMPHRLTEIIEFPAVLYNLKSGCIESEFHQYVQPTEKPILSDFCKNLTGIQQGHVDGAQELTKVLRDFEAWLKAQLKKRNLVLPKMSSSRPSNCVFVTWTDYDFNYFITKECQRKSIQKPQYFNQWINLKEIFINTFRHRAYNFEAALRFMGMQFEGQLHSGIDDARNTAKLAFKMCQRGALMKITRDLNPQQEFCRFSFH